MASKPAPLTRPSSCLLYTSTGRAQNELLPEHVARIHGWYRDYEDVAGVARVVTLEEIAANDHNLNIPRYCLLYTSRCV